MLFWGGVEDKRTIDTAKFLVKKGADIHAIWYDRSGKKMTVLQVINSFTHYNNEEGWKMKPSEIIAKLKLK